VDYFKTFSEIVKNPMVKSIAGNVVKAVGNKLSASKKPNVAASAPPPPVPNVPPPPAPSAAPTSNKKTLYIAAGVVGAALLALVVLKR
jgi:hypothetical protein